MVEILLVIEGVNLSLLRHSLRVINCEAACLKMYLSNPGGALKLDCWILLDYSP